MGSSILGGRKLADIISVVRQRCTMGTRDEFISDSEMAGYVNASYAELWDLIVDQLGEDYFVRDPVTFTTDGTSEWYSLPTDYSKTLGMDYQFVSGQPQYWISIPEFGLADRNKFNWMGLFGSGQAPRIFNAHFRPMDDKLWFKPILPAGWTIRHIYIPQFTNIATTPTITVTNAQVGDFIVLNGNIYYVNTATGATPTSTTLVPAVTGTGNTPAYTVYSVANNLATPTAPTLIPVTGTGTLPNSTYYYSVSAYFNSTTYHTVASSSQSVVLSSTGENVIKWLPVAGATGYKIFGRTGTPLLLNNYTGPLTTGNTQMSWTDSGVVTPSGSLDTTDTSTVSELLAINLASSITTNDGTLNSIDISGTPTAGVVQVLPSPVYDKSITKWRATNNITLDPPEGCWSLYTDGKIAPWMEYVINDVVIKVKGKEESDVQLEMANKQMLIDRINSAAKNRSLGEGGQTPDSQGNSGLEGFGGAWGGWGK